MASKQRLNAANPRRKINRNYSSSGRFLLRMELVGEKREREKLQKIFLTLNKFDKVNLTTIMQNNAKHMFDLTKKSAMRIIRTGDGMAPNRGQYAKEKQYGGGTIINFSHKDLSSRYPRRKYSGGYFRNFEQVPLPYRQTDGARYTEFEQPATRFHGLGILSGDLYNGVGSTVQHSVRSTVSTPDYNVKRGLFHKYTNVDIHVNVVFDTPDYIGYVHNGKAGVPARPFISVAASRINPKLFEHINKNYKKFRITNPRSVDVAFTIDPYDTEFSYLDLEKDVKRMYRAGNLVPLTWWTKKSKKDWDDG